MKQNAEQASATSLGCAWGFKTEKEAKGALAWVEENEPFIMSMGYTDGEDLDEQCEGIDWTSGALSVFKSGKFYVLQFLASAKELQACKDTLKECAEAEEGEGEGEISLWFSPCELEGFYKTYDPATGKACKGETFAFGMEGGTVAPMWARPTDVMQEALELALKHAKGEQLARFKALKAEQPGACPACKGVKDDDCPCVECGDTGKARD